MSAHKLILMGTGGHASVVFDLAKAAGYEVIGCVGPTAPQLDIGPCPHLGDDSVLDRIAPTDAAFAIAVGSTGDSTLRHRLFDIMHQRGFELPALVHPAAVVAGTARLGLATQVMARAVVQPHARIGHNVIVNTGAIVEHHAKVGDHTHVAPGAVLCGTVAVGRDCHIGANATVLQNQSIGDGTIVGAGAVVTRNIGAGARVTGIPAR